MRVRLRKNGQQGNGCMRVSGALVEFAGNEEDQFNLYYYYYHKLQTCDLETHDKIQQIKSSAGLIYTPLSTVAPPRLLISRLCTFSGMICVRSDKH